MRFKHTNRYHTGNHTGNGTGNHTGNGTGNKPGNKPGNKAGNHIGNKAGNKSGRTAGLKAGLLAAALLLLLTSCISVPSDSKDEPVFSGVEDGTTGAPSPVLPGPDLWETRQEALDAAERVLNFPYSGIVDISKQNYSYSEMEEDLEMLSVIYPGQFSFRSIGKSHAGRNIYLAVLGNPDAPKQVAVSVALHAREHMTVMLAMKQIEFYLQHYEEGSYYGRSYRELFEECCFYIIPMSNPDGVMLSQQGIESLPEEMRQTVLDIYHRENSKLPLDVYLSHWKANAKGVDLNRNYDAMWEEYDKAHQPSSSQFKGESPMSEPETKATAALIESLDRLVCTLCIHSQGEVIYWDCGQENREQTKAFAETVAKRNGYTVMYEQHNDASLSDWCELKKGILSVTVETGKGICPLPVEQFDKIWMDNFDLLPLTASYFRGN